MKNIILLCVAALGMLSSEVFSQPTAVEAKEKMKPFTNWAGHWKGKSVTQMRQAEPKEAVVDEHLTFKLDGAVLQIEGLGKATDNPSGSEAIVHNAMGILYFDHTAQKYGFDCFLHDGRHTAAWFDIVQENKYQWGFDIPSGKIRYTIILDFKTNTWDETGEFSYDNGNTWIKFFHMTLNKV